MKPNLHLSCIVIWSSNLINTDNLWCGEFDIHIFYSTSILPGIPLACTVRFSRPRAWSSTSQAPSSGSQCTRQPWYLKKQNTWHFYFNSRQNYVFYWRLAIDRTKAVTQHSLENSFKKLSIKKGNRKIKIRKTQKYSFFFLNVCCVMVLYVFLCRSEC